MSALCRQKTHDPTRLVRVVNKIDGYRALCCKIRCDPVQLAWTVKEIEGRGAAR